ncbi:MAG: chemotaxis protein CheD [Bacillota bacterium]
MHNHIAVGLSEIKVAGGKDDVLVAYSLGSCVGLAVWDPVTRIGGLAHIVLPSSGGSLAPSGFAKREDPDAGLSAGKYADTAVPMLVSLMQEAGCEVPRLKGYLAGGAHVLRTLSWPGGDIGAANVRAAQEAAWKQGITILKMDVGEDYGRTMRLYVAGGRVTVSSVGRTERDM